MHLDSFIELGDAHLYCNENTPHIMNGVVGSYVSLEMKICIITYLTVLDSICLEKRNMNLTLFPSKFFCHGNGNFF